MNSLKLPSICKSASRAVLSRRQHTLHAPRRTPRGASRLVLAMYAWSVKTRHAPSRHCRDARVYGHATTAMHEYRVHPHPPWLRVCKARKRRLFSIPGTLSNPPLGSYALRTRVRRVHMGAKLPYGMETVIYIEQVQNPSTCAMHHSARGWGQYKIQQLSE